MGGWVSACVLGGGGVDEGHYMSKKMSEILEIGIKQTRKRVNEIYIRHEYVYSCMRGKLRGCGGGCVCGGGEGDVR